MVYVVSITLESGKFYASNEKIHGFVIFVSEIKDAIKFKSIASAQLFIKQEYLSTKYHIVEGIEEDELR